MKVIWNISHMVLLLRREQFLLFDLFKAFDWIESCHKIFSSEKTFFFMRACSELPSNNYNIISPLITFHAYFSFPRGFSTSFPCHLLFLSQVKGQINSLGKKGICRPVPRTIYTHQTLYLILLLVRERMIKYTGYIVDLLALIFWVL